MEASSDKPHLPPCPWYVVINPRAGGHSKRALIPAIQALYPHHRVYWTETRPDSDYADMVRQCLKLGCIGIAAAGGDGTIQCLVTAVQGTPLLVGMLPLGSGNGLARGLGIPLSLKDAVRSLKYGRSVKLATGRINGHTFVNIAGVGLDGEFIALTHQSRRRGLLPYLWALLRRLFLVRYWSGSVVWSDGQCTGTFLSVLAGIGPEQGYGMALLPAAQPQSSQFTILLVHRKSAWHYAWALLYVLLFQKLPSQAWLQTIQSPWLEVHCPTCPPAQADGEPLDSQPRLTFVLHPESYSARVP